MQLIQPDTALAIVGMEVQIGSVIGLAAYERLIYHGGSAESQAASMIDLAGIVQRAIRNASLDTGPLRIANTVIDDVSGFGNQKIDARDALNPLEDALRRSRQLLDQGFDVVAVAAQSDAPSAAADRVGGFGFDRANHALWVQPGAAVVLLMDAARAEQLSLRIYAVIQSAAVLPARQNGASPAPIPAPPALDEWKVCIQSAIEAAGLSAQDIACVNAFACGIDAVDGIEIAGLVQTYRDLGEHAVALVSAQANIGYTGAAAGLLSLIHSAICLYHRYLPAVPGWNAPKLPALWRGAAFYVPTDTRPWFTVESLRRNAAVSVLGRAGAALHLVLQEAQNHAITVRQPYEAVTEIALLPLAGDSLNELFAGLARSRALLESGVPLMEIAAETCAAAQQSTGAAYGAALVGQSVEEVLRELALAERALPAAFERGEEWQTPLGSYALPNPVGRLGHVALVYPGAFNSYVGMGRDLFRLFPELYTLSARLTNNLGGVLRERQIFPRSLAALEKQDLAEQEAALLADAIAMLSSGTTLSILTTRLAIDILEIPVAAAFGYSLGENSMLFSTGVWAQGDGAAARLGESEVFRSRLAGRQEAIREFWQADQPVEDGALWGNYLLMVDADRARAEVAKHAHVYLTHINTPRQVVIGGDPRACQQVIASLGCSSLQAPFDYALHCEPMRSEFAELARLHDWPVEQDPGVALYTAVDMAPLPLEQHAIASKLAAMLTSPLDFPALIRKVYADGARIFIEVGAGSNCSRWIDETLRKEPHLAVSLNRRGSDDAHTLARALARLHCHRVPVNLSALYRSIPERIGR